MRREEKRKRLNEALVNILYPPPPSPPSQDEEEDIKINLDDHQDELRASDEEAKSESENESGIHKLTRAQRKRIRKKKLKEEAVKRGNLIGPLLPETNQAESHPTAVRCRDSENVDAVSVASREAAACDNQTRLKQRRLAKRVGKEKLKSSNAGDL